MTSSPNTESSTTTPPDPTSPDTTAATGTPGALPMIPVNIALALTVTAIWAVIFGPRYLTELAENWPVALTMVFGSLVGGGTSEGGGAVGFPMLTKALGVPADTARIFTFAIQGIGMTCASISILLARVPIERRAILWGAPPAILGATFSVLVISPHVPLPVVRVIFTMVLVALGIALVAQLLQRGYVRQMRIPTWGPREKILICVVGAAGGVLSGVAGVGENTLMFILIVLYFRVCEKITTPTTVVLMTIVSVTCFLLHVFVLGTFTGPVVGYWIAAAPVVAIGAPLGAWICRKMSPLAVRIVLFVLIGVELVSTVLIVPFTPALAIASVIILAAAGATCIGLTRLTRYARKPVDA